MSINRRIDEQIVVYSYSGIPYSDKKEWLNICHNMNESKIIMLSKWSQTQKAHTVWFSLYKVQEDAILIHIVRSHNFGKQRNWWWWLGRAEKELLADSNILYYDMDSGHTRVYICKKLVNYMFMMCSLYCVYIKCLYIFILT